MDFIDKYASVSSSDEDSDGGSDISENSDDRNFLTEDEGQKSNTPPPNPFLFDLRPEEEGTPQKYTATKIPEEWEAMETSPTSLKLNRKRKADSPGYETWYDESYDSPTPSCRSDENSPPPVPKKKRSMGHVKKRVLFSDSSSSSSSSSSSEDDTPRKRKLEEEDDIKPFFKFPKRIDNRIEEAIMIEDSDDTDIVMTPPTTPPQTPQPHPTPNQTPPGVQLKTPTQQVVPPKNHMINIIQKIRNDSFWYYDRTLRGSDMLPYIAEKLLGEFGQKDHPTFTNEFVKTVKFLPLVSGNWVHVKQIKKYGPNNNHCPPLYRNRDSYFNWRLQEYMYESAIDLYYQ